MAVTSFILVLWGTSGGVLERLTAALALLPMGNPSTDASTSVQIAQILAAVVFAFVAYAVVVALFGERVQEFRAGLMRDHVVVCGLGSQGQALVESLAGSSKVVAVEVNPANRAVRRLRDAGVIVLVGDSTDPEIARKARVSRARHVVSVCGTDATNARVGASLLEPDGRRAQSQADAFIHVADPRLYTFLLHHSFTARGPRLEFFNIYERGARGLIEEAGVPRNGLTEVLVAGAGQLGLALISQLARDHYERSSTQARVKKLRVHIVDREAPVRIQLLAQRYSRLSEVCDLEPHAIDVASPTFDHLLEQDPRLANVGVGFVCFDSDTLTIAATLNLLDQAHARFPVIARVTERSGGLAGIIEDVQSRYADATVFRPLTLAQRASRADLVLEGMRGRLARLVHDAYRTSNPGGPNDVPWDHLSDKSRERNLGHAGSIADQLEAVGYRLGPLVDWGEPLPVLMEDDVERMAELEHERWVAERLAEGWQYGPDRADDTRLHPDLVDWEKLPDDRREINRRLVGRRPAMLAQIGIQIYRA